MTAHSPEPHHSAPETRFWWEHPWLLAIVVLSAAIPLLWPDIPPLVDLPGHMGRFHVQLEIHDSPGLQRFYRFEWALIGNLGVDLLVIPVAKVIGVEAAVKLIIILIPVMTTAGLLWVAHEVHGRIPPTAFFALPLAYNFPFMFGFANFALSMALALLAFAFWLRLARLGRTGLRAALFVPISVLIWVAHTFGWGTLGVMAFSAEFVRQLDLKRGFFNGGIKAAIHCIALTPPVLLMLAWRSGEHVTGFTGHWFRWTQKMNWVLMALRDRWEDFDKASLAVIGLVLVIGLLWWRRLQYSRNLAASALFLAIVFVCLPRIVFGSNYADMRLAPYAVAVALIAIRFKRNWGGKTGTILAVLGLLFVSVRTAGTTASFYLYDKAYDAELSAVPHIPRDARLVSFVGVPCGRGWAMSRLEHLPAVALVRRDAFSNDQWSMEGAQLLTTHYPQGGRFATDPYQQVLMGRCYGEVWLSLNRSLAEFPRTAYDYVWLINPPPHDPRLLQGLRPIWRNGASVLYRVVDRSPPRIS